MYECKRTRKDNSHHRSAKTVVRAEWSRETRVATVLKPKGKHFNTFGRRVGRTVELFVEEALYLVDQAVLELFEDNLPLSIAECWSLLSRDMPLSHYLAFAHLLRLGYTVKRWLPRTDLDTAKAVPDLVKGVHAPAKKTIHTRSWWPGSWIDSDSLEAEQILPVTPKDLLWIKRLPRLGHSTVGRHDADTLRLVAAFRQKKKKPQRLVNAPACKVPLTFAASPLDGSTLQIQFDVFRPGRWRPTNPPPPAFHVIVHNMDREIPSAAAILHLTVASAPVPVKHCLSQGGTLAFFQMGRSTLEEVI